MVNNCDSIIFDMDGTLWDAVGTYAKSWNQYFEKNNIDKRVSKDYLNTLMGLEEKFYLEKVLPEFSVDNRKKIYNEVIDIQYDLIEKEGGIIYTGVKEGLEILSDNYKLFIVSNCPKLTIKYFIKWSGFGRYIVDTIAHGENFKPKHENIKLLKEKYKLRNSIYVGDTDSDRKQSEISKTPFIYMGYGFGECNDFYMKFNSFGEFTSFMVKNKIN